MTVRLLAFTDRGEALARTLAKHLDGEAARCGPDCPLSAWTEQAFSQGDALVFVGAAGIAVRAIAPYVKSKASDPAVVVVDEAGKYAIPILSGHLGGANALARRIAACIGGRAILTTATDLNQVFAVDLWAKAQGCAVPEPGRIKRVSARLLAGETVAFESDFPLPEPYPAGLTPGSGAGFTVSIDRKDDERLHLVPRIVTLGVGCKKATTQEAIEAAYRTLLDRSTLHPSSILQVCTIDRKGEEPGLLAFCAAHGWPLRTFSAGVLSAVRGTFTGSAFVEKTVGVDNVCERAAVLGSGGTLLIPKQAAGGVTLAAASAPFHPDWRWQDV